jgi:RNA polymerase sigma factor (sigma-70 family)
VEPDGAELFAFWPAMVRVCERVLGSREDAEDCASEALAQAYAEGVGGVENVEAWLVAIAKRRAMDLLRRRARSRRQLLRLASRCDVSDADPAERVADEAEARWLSARADELLTAPARAVLRVVADGGSVNDAAHRLAMTRRSAESHLHRARLTLRAARVAVPALAVAFARAVRRPATASVALVGVAVVAPAYLTPAAPERLQADMAVTVVREVKTVSPEVIGTVERTVPAPAKARRLPVERAVVAPVTTAPRRRDVARVPTSAAVVGISRDHRNGPSDAVGIVLDCVRHVEVGMEGIGC